MSVYQINVGYVYKFKFHSSIESIDGKYRLMNIMVLDDIIESGIDLYKDVFQPLGMTEDDYNSTVIPDLTPTTRIFKLQDVTNIDNIYYIPEFLIIKQPEFGVKPYLRLGLAVNLGIFKDSETLNWIKSEIEDILRSKAGIDKDAAIFAVEEVWLTPSEYQEIENQRKANISNTESIYVKNQNLQKEITNLQALISDYEDLIIQLSEE